MQVTMQRINGVSAAIVDAAIKVHSALGPGLLERIYVLALVHELRLRGFTVEVEKVFDTEYRGLHLAGAFRVDLLVDGLVIVEIKSTDGFHAHHAAQVLTYLKLSRAPLGLLLNFNGRLMKDGIKRFIGPSALTLDGA